MGAARYLQNWREFLGTYDHWRFLFAEWNKLIYLKSYLNDLREHKKNNAFIMRQNGLFMPTNKVPLTAAAPSIFIPDGLVITQKQRLYHSYTFALFRLSKFSMGAAGRIYSSKAGEWLLTIQKDDGGWPGAM